MSDEEEPSKIAWTQAHWDALNQIREIAKKHFDASQFFCVVDSDSIDTGAMAYRGFFLGGYDRGIGLTEMQRRHIQECYEQFPPSEPQ